VCLEILPCEDPTICNVEVYGTDYKRTGPTSQAFPDGNGTINTVNTELVCIVEGTCNLSKEFKVYGKTYFGQYACPIQVIDCTGHVTNVLATQ
jgi:hypothetical protein